MAEKKAITIQDVGLTYRNIKDLPKLAKTDFLVYSHGKFLFPVGNTMYVITLSDLLSFIGTPRIGTPDTWVQYITDLRAVEAPSDGDDVGVYTPVSGTPSYNNSLYEFDEANTEDDDGVDYIAPTDGTSGRWVRKASLSFAPLTHGHSTEEIDSEGTPLDEVITALGASIGTVESDLGALTALVALKAPINSPVFTGNPTTPDPTEDEGIANKQWVESLVGSFLTSAALSAMFDSNGILFRDGAGSLSSLSMAAQTLLYCNSSAQITTLTLEAFIAQIPITTVDNKGLVPALPSTSAAIKYLNGEGNWVEFTGISWNDTTDSELVDDSNIIPTTKVTAAIRSSLLATISRVDTLEANEEKVIAFTLEADVWYNINHNLGRRVVAQAYTSSNDVCIIDTEYVSSNTIRIKSSVSLTGYIVCK